MILALGVWRWSDAGKDAGTWMGIDLSNKRVARLFAGFFVFLGLTGAVMAFVAPGTGR